MRSSTASAVTANWCGMCSTPKVRWRGAAGVASLHRLFPAATGVGRASAPCEQCAGHTDGHWRAGTQLCCCCRAPRRWSAPAQCHGLLRRRTACSEDGHWRFSRRIIRDWSGPVLARFAGQDGARSARQLTGCAGRTLGDAGLVAEQQRREFPQAAPPRQELVGGIRRDVEDAVDAELLSARRSASADHLRAWARIRRTRGCRSSRIRAGPCP